MPKIHRIDQSSRAVGEIQPVLRKFRNAITYCHIYKERNVIAGKFSNTTASNNLFLELMTSITQFYLSQCRLIDIFCFLTPIYFLRCSKVLEKHFCTNSSQFEHSVIRTIFLVPWKFELWRVRIHFGTNPFCLHGTGSKLERYGST